MTRFDVLLATILTILFPVRFERIMRGFFERQVQLSLGDDGLLGEMWDKDEKKWYRLVIERYEKPSVESIESSD